MAVGGPSNKTMTPNTLQNKYRYGSVKIESFFPLAVSVSAKCKPKDMTDLERFCMDEWSKIPQNVFSNLIKHYRNRLSTIILARAVCNKY